MPIYVIWAIIFGVTLVAELLTGTFYLLMVAIGLAAGGLAAYLGAPVTAQLVVASVVAVAATYVWHKNRPARGNTDSGTSQDVQQDVGAILAVKEWQEDGTARVQYRGAMWQVALEQGHSAQAGQYRVVAVVANRLIVAPHH